MAGRDFANASMTSLATVRRPAGRTDQDEQTGRTTALYDDVFTTVCKVRSGALGTLIPSARERLDAGREVTEIRPNIAVPWDTPEILPNDVMRIDETGDYSDPNLLGKAFRVVAPIPTDYSTARRFAVETVTG